LASQVSTNSAELMASKLELSNSFMVPVSHSPVLELRHWYQQSLRRKTQGGGGDADGGHGHGGVGHLPLWVGRKHWVRSLAVF
jgi:hypothetical protein